MLASFDLCPRMLVFVYVLIKEATLCWQGSPSIKLLVEFIFYFLCDFVCHMTMAT